MRILASIAIILFLGAGVGTLLATIVFGNTQGSMDPRAFLRQIEPGANGPSGQTVQPLQSVSNFEGTSEGDFQEVTSRPEIPDPYVSLAAPVVGLGRDLTASVRPPVTAPGNSMWGIQVSRSPGGVLNMTLVPKGDINLDRIVDTSDFLMVASSLGTTPPYPLAADVNGEGLADVLDLAIVAAHFGEQVP